MNYLVKRNWEFWIVCWLLSVLAVLVVAVDCVIVVVTLLVLVRRVALRAVSSCCRAAWACCRSSCSCICSCCNWEAEGPEELSCPPAERLTPDNWDKSSASGNEDINVYFNMRKTKCYRSFFYQRNIKNDRQREGNLWQHTVPAWSLIPFRMPPRGKSCVCVVHGKCKYIWILAHIQLFLSKT